MCALFMPKYVYICRAVCNIGVNFGVHLGIILREAYCCCLDAAHCSLTQLCLILRCRCPDYALPIALQTGERCIVQTPCGHVYHKQCLGEAVQMVSHTGLARDGTMLLEFVRDMLCPCSCFHGVSLCSRYNLVSAWWVDDKVWL